MKDYYSLLRFLKNNLSLRKEISVRRVKLPSGSLGDVCMTDDGRFAIRIEKSLKEVPAIDTLIHEIAHCVAWHQDNGHGKAWGVAYSKVYRLYLKWLRESEAA